MLHWVEEGQGRPRVVLVHGFTQTLATWDQVATALAARRQVRRIDLPGHGGSAAVRLPFAEAAAAVGEAGGRAVYVGYSMGGRLCLRLAVDRPDLVAALVVVGASPGMADAGERAARRAADESLAAGIEAGGTGAFLERWLAQPLFATLRPPAPDLAARRANPPGGLAAALRLLGTGAQEPLWDRLPGLGVPTIVVAGEHDARYVEVARRTAAAIGTSASVEVIEGAGHAVHLEQPGRLVAAVERFLDLNGHAW